MRRIAVIHHGSPSSPALAALRTGLHRHGLVDGNHDPVDAAGVEGRWAELPVRIGQLLDRKPDVLVALGGLAALVAQRATSRIPVLHAIVLDPSDIGLRARNVSGVTTFDPDQATRHLRLLGQLVPGLRHVACLTDAEAPKGPDGRNPLVARLCRAARAQALGLSCVPLAGIDADLEHAFDTVCRARAQALVVLELPGVLARLGDIARLAEHHRLPTLSPWGWPVSGVLMQGAALHDAIDPLAAGLAVLCQGASVADLPLRTVRHERLVVHRGLAQRIGLAIPACILDRATQCIDDPPGDGAG